MNTSEEILLGDTKVYMGRFGGAWIDFGFLQVRVTGTFVPGEEIEIVARKKEEAKKS